jgi:hypothetical protein
MATRAKFGTKKALKSAKEHSRTAIAGGAGGAAPLTKAQIQKLTPRQLSGLMKKLNEEAFGSAQSKFSVFNALKKAKKVKK